MEQGNAEKRRKAKDRVLQLGELYRGLSYIIAAQYGTSDDPRFVISLEVEGQVFQGIGPSRKRAKTMAAEQVLANLSKLPIDEIEMPELETYHTNDSTADVFDSSSLFYNFLKPDIDMAQQPRTIPHLSAFDVGDEEGDDDDEYSRFVGRNSLSILSELRPDTTYRLLYEPRKPNQECKFVLSCKVDGIIFRGEARNKKLARARAARDALVTTFGMNFNHVEDGMPIYEGTGKLWQRYKAKLEEESHNVVGTFTLRNPVAQLHEIFPEVVYEFPNETDELERFFQCKVNVNGVNYDGIGLTKKEAKGNAATNALEDLQINGFLDQRNKELEAKKKAKAEKQKECASSVGVRPDKWFNTASDPSKNAVCKLNEICPLSEYNVVGEMPIRNTLITAFAMSVTVNKRTFIGIGKNKKLAKMAAAEKALQGLGIWTEENTFMHENLQSAETWQKPPECIPLGGPPVTGFRGRPGFGLRGQFAPRGRGFGYVGLGKPFWQGDGQSEGDWNKGAEKFEKEYQPFDSMIFKLSSIVAHLLNANPNMGASDVWRRVQSDDSWQNEGNESVNKREEIDAQPDRFTEYQGPGWPTQSGRGNGILGEKPRPVVPLVKTPVRPLLGGLRPPVVGRSDAQVTPLMTGIREVRHIMTGIREVKPLLGGAGTFDNLSLRQGMTRPGIRHASGIQHVGMRPRHDANVHQDNVDSYESNSKGLSFAPRASSSRGFGNIRGTQALQRPLVRGRGVLGFAPGQGQIRGFTPNW